MQRFRDTTESILEHLIDGHVGTLLITDAQIEAPGPHILYVSPGFTRLFGYEPHEVLGRSPRMFQGPLTERAVLDRLRAALLRGRPWAGATTNYRKDGSSFSLTWTISPLRQPNGAVLGFLAHLRDESNPNVLRQFVEGASLLRRLVDSQAEPPRPVEPSQGEDRNVVSKHIERVAAEAKLTVREREVLDLLLLGRTHAMIADTLGITVRTVRFHQERVFAKLGAESRHDLLRIFL